MTFEPLDEMMLSNRLSIISIFGELMSLISSSAVKILASFVGGTIDGFDTIDGLDDDDTLCLRPFAGLYSRTV